MENGKILIALIIINCLVVCILIPLVVILGIALNNVGTIEDNIQNVTSKLDIQSELKTFQNNILDIKNTLQKDYNKISILMNSILDQTSCMCIRNETIN